MKITTEEAIAELKDMPINYPLTNAEDKSSMLIQARDMAIEALNKCDKIEKVIDSYDAEFIANYVRGLFVE